jgi:hypothetical protein
MSLLRLALALSLVGCGGPRTLGAHVNPINAYRAYGEYHPASEDAAVVAKAATADPGTATIHLFQEALPPGIESKGDTFGVSAGYAHRLLGKYAYSSGAEQSKDGLVLMVKKMCVTTGANAAIIIFQMVPNDHQDRAQAIEAILVDLHEQPAPTTTPAAP